MKTSEVKDLILEMVEVESYMHQDDFDKVIEILKKQASIKPIVTIIDGIVSVDCPICDEGYAHNFSGEILKHNYCLDCGVKIDWSVGELSAAESEHKSWTSITINNTEKIRVRRNETEEEHNERKRGNRGK